MIDRLKAFGFSFISGFAKFEAEIMGKLMWQILFAFIALIVPDVYKWLKPKLVTAFVYLWVKIKTKFNVKS